MSSRLGCKRVMGERRLVGWWMASLASLDLRNSAQPQLRAFYYVPGENARSTADLCRGAAGKGNEAAPITWEWGLGFQGSVEGVPRFPDDAKTKAVDLMGCGKGSSVKDGLVEDMLELLEVCVVLLIFLR
jgi:hypothetical protein